jgi:hypothetical protein
MEVYAIVHWEVVNLTHYATVSQLYAHPNNYYLLELIVVHRLVHVATLVFVPVLHPHVQQELLNQAVFSATHPAVYVKQTPTVLALLTHVHQKRYTILKQCVDNLREIVILRKRVMVHRRLVQVTPFPQIPKYAEKQMDYVMHRNIVLEVLPNVQQIYSYRQARSAETFL